MRTHRALLAVVLGVAAATLSACGESTRTASTTLSAAQSEKARQIRTYIVALGKANEPFTHPSSPRITHAQAERLLRTAIAEVSALKPPPAFAASYRKILSGFRGNSRPALTSNTPSERTTPARNRTRRRRMNARSKPSSQG
jgi:hypothetical protein